MTLQRSGIVTVEGLTDKRVGIGPQGGTTGIYMPEFFKVLKINPTTRTGSWSDLAAAMEDGALDALAVGAGVPFPEFAMLGRRDKVRCAADRQPSGHIADCHSGAGCIRGAGGHGGSAASVGGLV